MVSLVSPSDLLNRAKTAFKTRRLVLGFTQAGLSHRSGVKLGTLRKFERTGQISFASLADLAMTLGLLEDLYGALNAKKAEYHSMKELTKAKKTTRRRGHIS